MDTKQHEMQLLQARGLMKCVSVQVKQKQAELDDLNLKLLYTQKYSEGLHGDVKAKKSLNQKTRTQKKVAEEQKLQQVMEVHEHLGWDSVLLLNIYRCHQDLYVVRLTEELERVTEQIRVYDLQIIAQSEKKERAKSSCSEVKIPPLNVNNIYKNDENAFKNVPIQLLSGF